MFDFDSSLRSLNRSGGELYAESAVMDAGDAGVQVIESKREDEKWGNAYLEDFYREASELKRSGKSSVDFANKVYNIDEQVRSWSDFRAMSYHRKSINCIPAALEKEMDKHAAGHEAWNSDCDSFEDSLRYFAEDCDRLQGFQFLFDMDDGFGGFAHRLLQHLGDEYRSKTVFAVPLLPDERDGSDYRWELAEVVFEILNFVLFWRAG